MTDVWTYRLGLVDKGQDLRGYEVVAGDGSIGKIDEATYEAGSSSVVVDTGFWIFGKKRMIPAGAIRAVDHQQREVQVALTKDQVKNAPDYDQHRRTDKIYRDQIGTYYESY